MARSQFHHTKGARSSTSEFYTTRFAGLTSLSDASNNAEVSEEDGETYEQVVENITEVRLISIPNNYQSLEREVIDLILELHVSNKCCKELPRQLTAPRLLPVQWLLVLIRVVDIFTYCGQNLTPFSAGANNFP